MDDRRPASLPGADAWAHRSTWNVPERSTARPGEHDAGGDRSSPAHGSGCHAPADTERGRRPSPPLFDGSPFHVERSVASSGATGWPLRGTTHHRWQATSVHHGPPPRLFHVERSYRFLTGWQLPRGTRTGGRGDPRRLATRVFHVERSRRRDRASLGRPTRGVVSHPLPPRRVGCRVHQVGHRAGTATVHARRLVRQAGRHARNPWSTR